MEFIREDCIYARQSVDRKDSISIESQIDFCKYELKVVAAGYSRTKAIPVKIRTGRSFKSCWARSARERSDGSSCINWTV